MIDTEFPRDFNVVPVRLYAANLESDDDEVGVLERLSLVSGDGYLGVEAVVGDQVLRRGTDSFDPLTVNVHEGEVRATQGWEAQNVANKAEREDEAPAPMMTILGSLGAVVFFMAQP